MKETETIIETVEFDWDEDDEQYYRSLMETITCAPRTQPRRSHLQAQPIYPPLASVANLIANGERNKLARFLQVCV